MRKTTIFRFSQLGVGCVLAVMVAPAQAQDTVLVPEPLQDTMRVGEQLQIGQQQDAHVVVEGETLWGLADLYLGDPFLWPEIYRLNTLVVEDPHWIFPGEELRLAPPDTTVVTGQLVVGGRGVAVTPQVIPGQTPLPPQIPGQTPQVLPGPAEPPVVEVEMPDVPLTPDAPPPPPSTESSPTIFRRAQLTLATFRGAASQWRSVRRGEFYAAGFLTEQQRLPWAEVLGAVGKPTLANLTASSSATVFGEIEVRPPDEALYAIGDSLLVARLSREVPGWGDVVVPTGIAEVTRIGEDRVFAIIVSQFGRVADGQVAMPLEPFLDPGMVVPVPVSNGVEGRVIEPRDRNPVPGQQDIIFIDLGRDDGIVLGDLFVVLREGQPLPADTVAYMQIVHVRERSASGFLTFINDLGVVPNALVRLFRKMPS